MSARSTTTAAMAAVLALTAAGCGGDEPQIPRDDSRGIVTILRTAERQAVGGACTTLVRNTIPSLERRVRLLPARTDQDIRDTLDDGIAHLRTLAAAECATREERPEETTTETTETEPTTTDTQTTDTTTDTTDTTTDTTDTTTDTAPPPVTDTDPSGGVPGQKKKGASKEKKGK